MNEEKHYTVLELAELWNVSDDFVRFLVRGEEGVIEFVHQKPGRRRKIHRRIPASVAERVYRKYMVAR